MNVEDAYIPTQDDWDDYAADQMAYELKPFDVLCLCGAKETDSEKNLRAKGWWLHKMEICPACVQREMQVFEQQALRRAA